MSKVKTDYKSIVDHYESKFQEHGDTHCGVDWPNHEDLMIRFSTMLELIRGKQPTSVLDFGCGNALLLEYILKNEFDYIEYKGLDLGENFINHCKKKYPNYDFIYCDALQSPEKIPQVDYAIMNGVFTEKCNLSHETMFDYFKEQIKTVFSKVNCGLAFNVMSKNVDWEREDLFHLSYDELSNFLNKDVSTHFVFRKDYGLYEYTTYVYKESSKDL